MISRTLFSTMRRWPWNYATQWLPKATSAPRANGTMGAYVSREREFHARFEDWYRRRNSINLCSVRGSFDMSHAFRLTWDLDDLAGAMHIHEEDVLAYFRDGRRVSFILERRIRDHFSGWQLAHSEGANYDLLDEKGGKWEVRSLSNSIYFCPSSMVGSGRRFEEAGFVAKLNSIEGYICSDITQFPDIPVFIVPGTTLRDLYDEGLLGMSTSISRASFYARVVPRLKAIDQMR